MARVRTAGRCINCVDKPKFGGNGIRKQSCMYKRCTHPKGPLEAGERQPLGEAGTNTPTTLVQPASRAIFMGSPLVATPVPPRKEFLPGPSSLGMPVRAPADHFSCSQCEVSTEAASAHSGATDNEDPLFWTAVEALLGAGAPRVPPPPREYADASMEASAATALSALPAALQRLVQHASSANVHAQYASHPAPAPPPALPPALPPLTMSPMGYETTGAAPFDGAMVGGGAPNNKRLRSARCGVCPGCNSGDCGECKNCLDKPRFGGPGCRKQACLQRTCSMPRMVDERENERENCMSYHSDGGGSDGGDSTPHVSAPAAAPALHEPLPSSAEATPPLAPISATSPQWVPDAEPLPECAWAPERPAVVAAPARVAAAPVAAAPFAAVSVAAAAPVLATSKASLQWRSMIVPPASSWHESTAKASPADWVVAASPRAARPPLTPTFVLAESQHPVRTYSEEAC
jgi:hypothetical protein|eukprot:jgi/Chrpa1/8993/Chrysochromulina_OHIO_Genome00019423-RA